MFVLDLLNGHFVDHRPVPEIFFLAGVRLFGVAAEFAVELLLDQRFELAILTFWMTFLVLTPQVEA